MLYRALLLLALVSARAGVAEVLPPASTNNLWYRNTDGDTVIVFVHGFLSDSRACWLSEDSRTYWPQLISTDPQFAGVAIFLGGYYTEQDSADYGVRHAADELMSALKRRDNLRKNVLDKKNVIFICHSLGGVVARYMIEKNFTDFADKNVGLILIASPSYGSEEANRLAWLAQLFGNQLGKDLKWGNETLKDLDSRFKDLIYQRRLKNLVGVEAYENHFIIHRRWWLSDISRVVTEDSAGRYFGAPKLLRNTDHFTCVKPTSRSHPTYELLIDFYQQQYLPLLARAVGSVPASPGPVYERQWTRRDNHDREFSEIVTQVSTIQLQNAYQLATGTYRLTNPEGRIYRVDFAHNGEACATNTNPDGGLGGKVLISGDGKSFAWFRRWAGGPCTEIYTMFYEVQRTLCVSNCR